MGMSKINAFMFLVILGLLVVVYPSKKLENGKLILPSIQSVLVQK